MSKNRINCQGSIGTPKMIIGTSAFKGKYGTPKTVATVFGRTLMVDTMASKTVTTVNFFID